MIMYNSVVQNMWPVFVIAYLHSCWIACKTPACRSSAQKRFIVHDKVLAVCRTCPLGVQCTCKLPPKQVACPRPQAGRRENWTLFRAIPEMHGVKMPSPRHMAVMNSVTAMSTVWAPLLCDSW